MKVAPPKVEPISFEDLVMAKLIGIEGRLSIIETHFTWIKTVTKISVIAIAGFFGINLTGVI